MDNTCGVGHAVTSSSAVSAIGEHGTGGRILRLTGRFFCLGRRVGSWKSERIAVIGGVTEDGSRVGRLVGMDEYCDVLSASSGEVAVDASSAWLSRASWSNSPPTPSNSCSSSSSMRYSLGKLLFVLLLAMDSVRLRGAYRLRQAAPIPIPEPAELIDDAEDLRATTRSSMALSSAWASCIITLLSPWSGSSSEASSNILRRRPHSSSSSVPEEPSESGG